MKSVKVGRNIRVTMRKSSSLGRLSISSNSVSMVVKRTTGISAAGAISSGPGVGAGVGLELDMDAETDAETDAMTGARDNERGDS